MCVLVENSAREMKVFITNIYEVKHPSCSIVDHLKTCSAREQKELIEWKRILQSMSIPRLKRFLVDDSERAIRLRQSSPFVGALSQDELEEIRESK